MMKCSHFPRRAGYLEHQQGTVAVEQMTKIDATYDGVGAGLQSELVLEPVLQRSRQKVCYVEGER